MMEICLSSSISSLNLAGRDNLSYIMDVHHVDFELINELVQTNLTHSGSGAGKQP